VPEQPAGAISRSRPFVRLSGFAPTRSRIVGRVAARSRGNLRQDTDIAHKLEAGRMYVRQGWGRRVVVAADVGNLATEVRARRAQLRLRQEELADLAGVSERFVYALENGKKTVQLDKVVAVLNALGLHLEIHRGADPEIR
jgi:HTH-type transcriptional regulator / antitoxin HipB